MAAPKIRTEQIETLEINDINQLQTQLDGINAKIMIDVNDANVSVGMYVFGTKAGINDGNEFIGKVLTAPPTQDSHILFLSRINPR